MEMKPNALRKQLQSQYKEREIIGGVYVIRNMQNQKLLLKTDTDLQGSKNRFAFSQKTGSCVDLKLQSDWSKQCGEHFVFEELETLTKSETQTMAQFKEDLAVLKELWLDKLAGSDLY